MITGTDLLDWVDLGPDKLLQLDLIAQGVVDLWEAKTGRLWTKRTDFVHEVTLESRDRRSIWVPLYPVIDLTAEEWPDAEAYGGTSTRTLEAEEYSVDARMGRVDRMRSEPWLGTRVRLTLSGGYTEPPTALIKRALITQAQFEIAALKPESLHSTNYSANRSNTNFRDPDMHPYFAQVVADNERHV